MSEKKSITGIAAIIISAVSLCCSAVCLFTAAELKAAVSDRGSTVPDETRDNGKVMQYVMYVGTNDKDTYKLEMTKEEAREIVDNVCLKYFPDGYTLQEAVGAWTDEKNNITHEYTFVCYFDYAEIETVHKAADEVIEKLNQNSVLIEEDEIRIDYYSGN